MVHNKQVAIRYPSRDIKNIEEMVALGYANTVSDYIRTATREKILRDKNAESSEVA